MLRLGHPDSNRSASASYHKAIYVTHTYAYHCTNTDTNTDTHTEVNAMAAVQGGIFSLPAQPFTNLVEPKVLVLVLRPSDRLSQQSPLAQGGSSRTNQRPCSRERD
jgi:hypothetical protein